MAQGQKETADDAEAATVATQQQPEPKLVAELANGVTVELLGVCYNPSAGKQWWQPDGSVLAQAPYEDAGVVAKSDEKRQGYELVVRVDGPRNLASFWDVPSSLGTASSNAPRGKDGKHILGLRVHGFSLPRDKQSTSVRLGVAAGEWQTLVSESAEDMSIHVSCGFKDGSAAFLPAYEEDGVTVKSMVHTLREPNVRVVAVSTSGEVHAPRRVGSRGSFDSAMLTLGDCPSNPS